MSLLKCDVYTQQEIMSRLDYASFKNLWKVCSSLYNMALPVKMIPKKAVKGLYLYDDTCSIWIEREAYNGTEWFTIETTFDPTKNISIARQDLEGANFETISLCDTDEDLIERFIECLQMGTVHAENIEIQNIPEKFIFDILDNVFRVKRIVVNKVEYTVEMCEKLKNTKVEDIWIESNSHNYEIYSNQKSVLLLGAEENVEKIQELLTSFYNGKFKFPSEMLTLTLKTGRLNANFFKEIERLFPLDKLWIFDDFGKAVQPQRSILEHADRENIGMKIFLQNANSDDVIRTRESILTDSETLSIDFTHFAKIPSVRL